MTTVVRHPVHCVMPQPKDRPFGDIHPGAVLSMWIALVLIGDLALVNVSIKILVGAVVAMVTTAIVADLHGFLVLLRRSRWLLLCAGLAALWGTPGEFSPAVGFVTVEGIAQAAHVLARWVIALAALGILMRILPVNSLLEAIHGMVIPVAILVGRRQLADRFALRLAMTIELVGAEKRVSTNVGQFDNDVMQLSRRPLRGVDQFLLLIVAAALCARLLSWN